MFCYWSYFEYFLKVIKNKFSAENQKIIFEKFQNETISIFCDSKEEFWKNLYLKKIKLVDYKRNCLKIKKFLLFHEPVPYITKKINFYNLQLSVSKGVFIPQKETEILIDSVEKISRKIWKSKDNLKVLEIGTGSGAIPICLSFNNKKKWKITSVDINKKALCVAKKNSYSLGLKNINFLESNLFSRVSGKFNVIISNPPYICREDYYNLCKRTKKQPKKSLLASKNGLWFYYEITRKIQSFLEKDFLVVFELGKNHFDDVEAIIIEFFKFKNIAIENFNDYLGFKRVIAFYNLS